jgi:hypothetical protein
MNSIVSLKQFLAQHHAEDYAVINLMGQRI